MVIAPMLPLDITGASGDTCFSPLHDPLHRWYGTGVSDAGWLDRCSVTGASGATISAELV